MDNQRLFLYAALGFILLLLWQAWQQDYNQPAPQPGTVSSAQPGQSGDPNLAPPTDPNAEPVTTRANTGGETITVTTDLFEARINTAGGVFESIRLRQYTVSVEDETLVEIINAPQRMARAGLKSRESSVPGSDAVYATPRSDYRLGEGQDEIRVPLTWTGEGGVTVTKTYVFKRNSYLIDLQQSVRNDGGAPWQGFQFTQVEQIPVEQETSLLMMGARTFVGGVLYSPEEKFEKIKFEDFQTEQLNRDITGGWAGVMEHYFITVWIPPAEQLNRYFTRTSGDYAVIGLASAQKTAQPGESVSFNQQFFAGPKEQDRLEAAATGLERTVDYGMLYVISKPLFVALDWIHGYVGNWGWAIVILTLLIKLAFYWLSEKSYRSMAKMRTLQPKMQSLKERYGDDKQKMQQELMALYKKEKINPLGGCLPIVVQIPVFISLYWMLLESVELRQAEWIFWINDLSAADPYFVLPLLMGASMFLQQKLNPAPLDPIQQKVMTFLPVMFTVFFLFFPSGLVLYWLTNNILSISQQWVITRRIEGEAKKKAG